MTHVFIVDVTTLKYHLEYMFAGTGAKDKQSVFLYDDKADLPSATERMLVGMIADISKIRIGDKVVFYLQSKNGVPGMFFGVFRVVSMPFFDENDEHNYLYSNTQKGLSFRVLIAPDTVYAKGVTEHEYLDSLQGKEHPSDLCWSLIYRKLKGNRGCTMIMDYEYTDLLEKLKWKNDDETIDAECFTFDAKSYSIAPSDISHVYEGRKESLNILPRLLYKASKKNAFETHLQAFILQNFDSGKLSELLIPVNNAQCWIGNEVSCGVGMQRIDVMIKQETFDNVYIKLIELKDEAPKKEILSNQIKWYLQWISDYVIPKYSNKKVYIIPTVIAKGNISKKIVKTFSDFTFASPRATIQHLEYIGFEIADNSILFNKYL